MLEILTMQTEKILSWPTIQAGGFRSLVLSEVGGLY